MRARRTNPKHIKWSESRACIEFEHSNKRVGQMSDLDIPGQNMDRILIFYKIRMNLPVWYRLSGSSRRTLQGAL